MAAFLRLRSELVLNTVKEQALRLRSENHAALLRACPERSEGMFPESFSGQESVPGGGFFAEFSPLRKFRGQPAQNDICAQSTFGTAGISVGGVEMP